MKLYLGILAIGLLSAISFAADKVEGEAPKKAKGQKLVMEVSEVTVTKDGTAVTITAKGQVNSGGWSKPVLVPYIYVTPPADGVYTFEFVANEPEGMSTMALAPVEAKHVWKDVPAGAKSVRVVSSSNEQVKPLAK